MAPKFGRRQEVLEGPQSHAMRPVIGITADANEQKYLLARSYIGMIEQAGGTPIILPCAIGCAAAFLEVCDGIILSGGDDPDTTRWGVPLHPQANPVHPQRQAFEVALLEALDAHRSKPALGICLGMQLMGLHHGGTLDQRLADHLPTAGVHWDVRQHEVSGELGRGVVSSHHRQALAHPGRMRVIARAPDGVIEAVQLEDRDFYLGVQWHPERTADPSLGLGVIGQLVAAAGR